MTLSLLSYCFRIDEVYKSQNFLKQEIMLKIVELKFYTEPELIDIKVTNCGSYFCFFFYLCETIFFVFCSYRAN